MSLISVRDLHKTFPNGTEALKGLSFDVEEGEFLVVIGLSGSGKSTLLRCLNLLQTPSAGEVFFQGRKISDLQSATEIRSLRARMGMIFQHFNLVPRQSVLKNVLMGLLSRKSSWSSFFSLYTQAEKQQALENLKLVGLADKAYLRADQMSGGQKQRVAIARALMQDPALILADEPVSALDPATCHLIMNYLQKVQRERRVTVIANLHFLSLVRQYATRVIALRDGKIVFTGSPEEITDEWYEKIYGEVAHEPAQNTLR